MFKHGMIGSKWNADHFTIPQPEILTQFVEIPIYNSATPKAQQLCPQKKVGMSTQHIIMSFQDQISILKRFFYIYFAILSDLKNQYFLIQSKIKDDHHQILKK